MRLDARNGDRGNVYHAEECRELRRAVWVDDEIPAWAESTGSLSIGGEVELRIYSARKILILRNESSTWHTIIINPIEDSDPSSTDTERERELHANC